MALKIDIHVKTKFPGLQVLTCKILDVKIEKRSTELEKFAEKLMEQVRLKYDLKSLKNLPTFRAYRDFFWKAGIDPTKNRPAAEALIRRILGGKAIPQINTLVDAYNLASVNTEVPLAAFDMERLKGDLAMHFAEKGEEFVGIGMEKPMRLLGGEIVISDAEKLVAIYPYRDAENTKITTATNNVLLLVCGVPDISEETLRHAAQVATDYICAFCGGAAHKVT
jgi:DNA/RNA-binding domain of Phe-tRNA-synthetase-like protein